VQFEEFAAAQLPGLLRFATALTGDPGSAEDVVQEVLVKAYLRWRHIADMDNPEAYLRRMIINQFISLHRRMWRWISTPDVSIKIHIPDHATNLTERDALIGELAKLPKKQRAVLVLRYFEGCSDAEIAEILNCSPVTVRSQACRALAKLRVELKPTFKQDEEAC
jgi:RNA polymerase sigma-70 factor (sigma-E family)